MIKIPIDTGPLVALFDGSDRYHNDSLDFIKNIKFPLCTTLPVVTETVFMLDFSNDAQCDFISWIHQGGLDIIELKENDFGRIAELMTKYSSLPMDFADASLVIACEKLQTRNIATLDGDFNIYRYQHKFRFNNIFKT